MSSQLHTTLQQMPLAERFVQTFKKSIKAMEKENFTLQHKVEHFLFVYLNSVHSTTNQTPAMLFLNRPLRSRIDLLKPNLRREVQNKQFYALSSKAKRSFDVGQQVLACDYRDNKWTPGRIVTRNGPLIRGGCWRADMETSCQSVTERVAKRYL